MSSSRRPSHVQAPGQENEHRTFQSSRPLDSKLRHSSETSADNMSFTTRSKQPSSAASLQDNFSNQDQPLRFGQTHYNDSDSSGNQSSFSSEVSRASQAQSLLVKLKMPPPPRTRQMDEMSADSARTSNTQPGGRSRPSHNIFAEPVILSGPRNSRNKRPIVEVDSDEDDDLEEDEEDEGDEEGEEDAAGEYVDDEEDEEDADGDMDMDDAPPVSSRGKSGRQILKLTSTRAPTTAAAEPQGRSTRNAHANTGGKSITQSSGRARNKSKYAEEEDDGDSQNDNSLSSLPSDEIDGDENEDGNDDDEEDEEEDEEEEDDEEMEDEAVNAGGDDDEANEIDADGEPDDAATPAAAASSSDEDDDEDDETISTDPSRLTKRQRGNLGTDFLQLPMEPQIKKHLTEEEHAMRRAEMARRRKNLSEKRNEEEKMDVINKLLRKQAPKKRGRVSTVGTVAAVEDEKGEKPEEEPLTTKEALPKENMIRYVWGRDGCRLGVPQKWIESGVGSGVIVSQKTEPLS